MIHMSDSVSEYKYFPSFVEYQGEISRGPIYMPLNRLGGYVDVKEL